MTFVWPWRYFWGVLCVSRKTLQLEIGPLYPKYVVQGDRLWEYRIGPLYPRHGDLPVLVLLTDRKKADIFSLVPV